MNTELIAKINAAVSSLKNLSSGANKADVEGTPVWVYVSSEAGAECGRTWIPARMDDALACGLNEAEILRYALSAQGSRKGKFDTGLVKLATYGQRDTAAVNAELVSYLAGMRKTLAAFMEGDALEAALKASEATWLASRVEAKAAKASKGKKEVPAEVVEVSVDTPKPTPAPAKAGKGK